MLTYFPLTVKLNAGACLPSVSCASLWLEVRAAYGKCIIKLMKHECSSTRSHLRPLLLLSCARLVFCARLKVVHNRMLNKNLREWEGERGREERDYVCVVALFLCSLMYASCQAAIVSWVKNDSSNTYHLSPGAPNARLWSFYNPSVIFEWGGHMFCTAQLLNFLFASYNETGSE